jgi:hypothetical protein
MGARANAGGRAPSRLAQKREGRADCGAGAVAMGVQAERVQPPGPCTRRRRTQARARQKPDCAPARAASATGGRAYSPARAARTAAISSR